MWRWFHWPRSIDHLIQHPSLPEKAKHVEAIRCLRSGCSNKVWGWRWKRGPMFHFTRCYLCHSLSYLPRAVFISYLSLLSNAVKYNRRSQHAWPIYVFLSSCLVMSCPVCLPLVFMLIMVAGCGCAPVWDGGSAGGVAEQHCPRVEKTRTAVP